MIMLALYAVALVLLAILLFAADRAIKALRRGRRRRHDRLRLAAVAVRVDAEQEQRKSAAAASRELTSLMPAIHDRGPRRVA